ncbi:MAG TPA: hypothetical protein VJR92_09855 [Gemmatimonadaceae bacterium]|nr:hypothetical protein [Gemmatimonadaceae bacterium]
MRRVLLCASLFLAVHATTTQAQSAAVARRTYWGQVNLGVGGVADSAFYATGFSGGIQTGRTVFIGRVVALSTKAKTRITEVGLMTGVATRPSGIHASIAAGLGIVDASSDSSSLGFPVEAQITVRPLRWIGVGVHVFGNLNKTGKLYGVTIPVQIGRLRL